jgi:hypothetical protein
MDHELLVDPQIEDGKALIAHLVRDGFDITVAFWVKTSEEGLWFLYLGSKTVAIMTLADAYRAIFAALRQIPNAAITLSQIKLVAPDNPIAAEVIDIRDRYPARWATRYLGQSLGKVFIEEAYIYPWPPGPMSPSEVIQRVAHLMERTGALASSLVTLGDGTQFEAVPMGIQRNDTGGVQIAFHDLASGSNRSVSADDVVSIL